jgi:hypothetical protein
MTKSVKYNKICLYCGRTFITSYSLAKYCCEDHKLKETYKRVKEYKKEVKEALYKDLYNHEYTIII